MIGWRQFTFVLILAAAASSAVAQTNTAPLVSPANTPDLSGKDPAWFKDPVSNCWTWDKDQKPGDTFTWQGACADGLLSGKGVLTWYQGRALDVVEAGTFERGKEIGHGTNTWENGDKYEGEFAEGMRNGHGILTWANGNKYDGDFVKGGITGQGTLHLANGKVYHGDFVDGVETGRGILTEADGNKYDGEFVGGEFSGHGTLIWTNGDKYVGDFVKNDRNGKATIIWANGNKYTGTVTDGAPDGEGTEIWKDASKYTGNWLAGERSGQGSFTYKNGVNYTGAFPGSGTYTRNGRSYPGTAELTNKGWHYSYDGGEGSESDDTGSIIASALFNGLAQGVAQSRGYYVPPPTYTPPSYSAPPPQMATAAPQAGSTDMTGCVSSAFQRAPVSGLTEISFQLSNRCGSNVTISFCSTGTFRYGPTVGESVKFPCESSQFGAVNIVAGSSANVLVEDIGAGGTWNQRLYYTACSFPGWFANLRWTGSTISASCSSQP